MIICVCSNLDDKDIKQLKKDYPNSYIAVLAKRQKDSCLQCVKYLKKEKKDDII